MVRFIMCFLVVFAARAEDQVRSLELSLIKNAARAIRLYGLDGQIQVGEINPENKRVVMCEPNDEKALFDFLKHNPDWRRDRFPGVTHKGRKWAFRGKEKPSLHITLVDIRESIRNLIETDIDRAGPSFSHFWNIFRHFGDVFYHWVTGKVTSQESIERGLTKLEIKFQKRILTK